MSALNISDFATASSNAVKFSLSADRRRRTYSCRDESAPWALVEPTYTTTTVWVKKSPLKFSDIFSQTVKSFFVQILHAYFTFLSTLDYKILFNYLQLWRSYAISSSTTQLKSYVQNVHHWPKRKLAFSAIFPKQVGILVQILHTYYPILSTLDYKFLFNYLQLWQSYAILSATTQCAFRPMVDILSI